MEEDRDLVVFEDEDGDQFTMEVLDYVCYEGREYALMTEYVQEIPDSDEMDVMIMEVIPVEEDQEEFVPVDEEIAKRVLAVFRSNEFEDVFEEDEEE